MKGIGYVGLLCLLVTGSSAFAASFTWSTSIPSAEPRDHDRVLEYYAPDAAEVSKGSKGYFLLYEDGLSKPTRFPVREVQTELAGSTIRTFVSFAENSEHYSVARTLLNTAEGVDYRDDPGVLRGRTLMVSVDHLDRYRIWLERAGADAASGERLMGYVNGLNARMYCEALFTEGAAGAQQTAALHTGS